MKSPTLRRRVHEIIEVAQPGDRQSRVCDIALMILILANVIAVSLESVAWIDAGDQGALEVFEALSVAIFTIEYLARLWSAVDSDEQRFRHPVTGRLRFAMTPMAVIDLLAILPFYLAGLVPIDLRFLRGLRLVRLFKLTPYSATMTILLNVLREEAKSFLASVFILLLLTVLAAGAMYVVEHSVQPEAFSSIPATMWWALVTLTTVGYGDVVPVTVAGKILGAAITVIGIGMVALPAGILASAFSEQLRRSRTEFEGRIHEALIGGVITPEDEERLVAARDLLGLSAEEANFLLHRARALAGEHPLGPPDTCPHCGGAINAPTDHR